MTDAILSVSAPWWRSTPPGRLVRLAFIKVDRVGSARDWAEIPGEEVLRGRNQYTEEVQSVARQAGAAQPLRWQGDGVMLFLEGLDAPKRAWRAAQGLWDRIRVHLGQHARIAVHAAYSVPWDPETGKLSHPAIDHCGHLEHDAPADSVTVSETVYLEIPESERRLFAPLGATVRDGIPAYAFPAAAADRKAAGAFREPEDLVLWDAFRRYSLGADVRLLRYVGFELQRKEPPALDIEEVFVPPQADLRRGAARPPAPPPDEEPGLRAEGRGAPNDLPFAVPEEPSGPPRLVTEILIESQSLVVLGEPGSGKTTLLKWLAVSAARGPWAWAGRFGSPRRLLPLPMSIGTLADLRRQGDSVVDAASRYFHARSVGDEGPLRNFLSARLKAGDCLVLLDGLDEVRSSEREEIRAWLEAFASQGGGNWLVASSRRVGYLPLSIPGATEVTLRPFEDDQVERYVHEFTRSYRRWETGIEDPGAESQAAADLLAAIRASPRLWALARNPFLLSALALIHRAEGRLPRHRVRVHEMFTRALCETWGRARRMVPSSARPDIPYDEEGRPVLGALALAMHEHYPSGIAPREFVLDQIARALSARNPSLDAREIRTAAERFLDTAGKEVQILCERGAGEWGFLHLTFQEFLAAVGLHSAEQFETVALDHLFDPRWEEVIRLGVGYMAIVQGRGTAAARFIEEVLRHRDTRRPWVTEVLRRQVPIAALLAAEAGDTLPAALQESIAIQFAAWVLEMPGPMAARLVSEIALSDFREVVARPLAVALRREDSSIRWLAAEILGVMKAEAAVLPLVGALEDTDASVRWHAADALGAMRAAAAVSPLIETLKDTDAYVRWRAADALGAMKAEAAVPPLIDALKDTDASVRVGAAEALGAMKAEAAAPPLIEALKDSVASVRGSAARALGAMRAEAAVSPLIEALKGTDAHVRWRAADALGAMKAEAAVPPLIEALKDTDASVRCRAADALGAMRVEAAVPGLIEALKDTDASVRCRAADALGAMKAEAAVPPLIEALKDTDAHVRRRAADALGAMKAEAAIPALIDALRATDARVRWSAAAALGAMKAEAAVPPLIEAIKDTDAYVRGSVAAALWVVSDALPRVSGKARGDGRGARERMRAGRRRRS